MKIKVNDEVIVIAGKDKGKTGNNDYFIIYFNLHKKRKQSYRRRN